MQTSGTPHVALLPHVVPGPAGIAGPSRLSVAVPVREADATVWLPQPEIQRMLAAGWTATGGPSEEYLSSLIQQAVTAARQDAPPPSPAFQVGEGPEPGWKGLADGIMAGQSKKYTSDVPAVE